MIRRQRAEALQRQRAALVARWKRAEPFLTAKGQRLWWLKCGVCGDVAGHQCPRGHARPVYREPVPGEAYGSVAA